MPLQASQGRLPTGDARKAAVVTKAVLKAGERLGIPASILARIIGLSEPTVSRMKRGEYTLAPAQKPYELAVLFIRLFRSLDAIVGGDEDVARAWLGNDNLALRGRPIDMMQTVPGLVYVIEYLDARRAVL
ncbi:MAG: DUF2384 domain-containing protein [Hyphomicrobiales bacterium]|nr:MAG: DUF2384 domain-containing protein [Hyphomicrobiales bacterium]